MSPSHRYVDPPDDERCTANITLRDGSQARCGRRRRANTERCWQHPAESVGEPFKGFTAKFLDYDARRQPKTSFSCVKCQKDLKPGEKYRVVQMPHGEPFVVHPRDAHLVPDGVWHFIGHDCAKRLGLEWTHPPQTSSDEVRVYEASPMTIEQLQLYGKALADSH
jgi:hypothetical protein